MDKSSELLEVFLLENQDGPSYGQRRYFRCWGSRPGPSSLPVVSLPGFLFHTQTMRPSALMTRPLQVCRSSPSGLKTDWVVSGQPRPLGVIGKGW